VVVEVELKLLSILLELEVVELVVTENLIVDLQLKLR
jgi:hypothetical protein